MMKGEGKVVSVTGASGFIASSLVKDLLLNGYTVHATVRNPGDPIKVGHLKALEGAKERLKLFKTDLLEQGSFDAAVDGCDGVFHTASPVILNDVKDPQLQLIKPALDGTLNVLASCLKAPSIKRVVLTSSMAAVAVCENTFTTHATIDETWYSDPIFCEKTEAWYALSKTLAEDAARKFAKQHGIDLVVINPGLVIGRCLLPNVNFTFEDFLQLITEGKSATSPIGVCTLVDIRNVVDAHILAFENPLANGRYCLALGVMKVSQVFDILRLHYPTLALPEIDEDSIPEVLNQISKAKAESLGINFIPIEDSIRETIELFKERSLLVIP